MGLLEETVGLVRVRQVGTGADHVGHLLGQGTEHGGAGTAGGGTGLLLYFRPVDDGCLAAEPVVQLLGLLGMTLGPLSLLGVALSHNLLQFLTTFGVEFLYFGEDLEGILGIGTQVLHGLDEVVATEGSTVGSAVALIRRAVGLAGTLAHDAVADNQARTLLLSLSLTDSLANLVDIVAVDLLYIPSPGLILLGGVLAGDHLGAGRELDVVGIVEHDEVVESQVAGDAACALRNLLLHAAVGDVGVDGLIHHVAQTSLEEFGCDGSTHGKGVALAQRTGGVLDAALQFTLGVTGSDGAPLTQLLQVLQRIFADEGQLRVEHRSHVAWVEEETVAALPCGVLRVVDEEFTVQGVDEISTAHGATGVTALCFFYHCGSQDSDVVGCLEHYFVVVHIFIN